MIYYIYFKLVKMIFSFYICVSIVFMIFFLMFLRKRGSCTKESIRERREFTKFFEMSDDDIEKMNDIFY